MGRSRNRLHARRGKTVTVHEWTDDGTTDDRGKPNITEATRTAVAVYAEPQGRGELFRLATGEEVRAEVDWIFEDGDEPTVSADGSVRNPEIVDPDGIAWVVAHVGAAQEGTRTAACSRKRRV